MKYHSCEVHFLLLLHQFSRKHSVHETVALTAIYYCSSKIFRRFACDFNKIMLCVPSLPTIQNLEIQRCTCEGFLVYQFLFLLFPINTTAVSYDFAQKTRSLFHQRRRKLQDFFFYIYLSFFFFFLSFLFFFF